MNPQKIKGTNRSLGPPRGVGNDECGRLAIRTGRDGRFPTMQSAWKPTPEELIILKSGGSVILTVFAEVHPMVSIHAALHDVEEDSNERAAEEGAKGS